MASKQAKKLVFEYWFRVIIGCDISVAVISKIASEYAAEYEIFDAALIDTKLKIEEDGQTLRLPEYDDEDLSSFGIVTATPGNKYHWRLELIRMDVGFVNLGIIEANKCDDYTNTAWWLTEYGYSYYSGDGGIYHKFTGNVTNTVYKDYAESYKDDIIDIWLDLKDNYQLSFAKNDIKFGKATDVKDSVDYKLAVAISALSIRNIIKILSFEIC